MNKIDISMNTDNLKITYIIKKVNFNVEQNIPNDILKRPCCCIGCKGCSVYNHHCNLFSNTKCYKCKIYNCNNCLYNNECTNCIEQENEENEEKKENEEKEKNLNYMSIIDGYDICFNLNINK
jgi:hypothetical protein